MDDYFKDKFDITTTRVDYASKGGLESAANESLDQLITDDENPFVVAHSMGGLVTRKMHEMDDSKFTGYVTFGTPHQGAYFANSYLNGDVKDYTINFMDQVIFDIIDAAIGGEKNYLKTILELFNVDNSNKIEEAIFYLIELIVKEKADDNTIGDLKVGGSFINNLKKPDLPKVNFYGVEDSPVHWRFVGSFGNIGNGDEGLLKAMNTLENIYEIGYYTSLATSITCGIASFFNPICIPVAIWAGNLSIQLNQAINNLEQSEAGWLTLIGAVEGYTEDCWYEEVLTGWDYNHNGSFNDSYDIRIRDSCRWIKYVKDFGDFEKSDTIEIKLPNNPCDSIDGKLDGVVIIDEIRTERGDEVIFRRPGICNDFKEKWTTFEHCTRIYHTSNSDGFVTEATTKEETNIDWIELRHLNHDELKYDDAVKDNLEDIFSHKGDYDGVEYNYFHLKQ